MRCTQTTEIMALHRTGKTLTDRLADNINELTGDIVISSDLNAWFQYIVSGNTEFSHFTLRLNLCFGKVAALGFIRALDFRSTSTELHCRITVFFVRADCHDLAILELQHRYRHLGAVFGEDTGHTHLAGDNSGTLCCCSHCSNTFKNSSPNP